MGAIKMSDIPCEVTDTHEKKSAFGTRLANILKRVNFQEREKIIFHFEYNWLGDAAIRLFSPCIDTQDGAPIALQHSRRLTESMSDEQIIREIFVLVVQYQAHEYMENFRYDGKILFDPHKENRNDTMFEAIEKCAQFEKPQPKDNSMYSVTVQFYTPTFQSFTPKEKAKRALPDVDVETAKKEMTPLDKAREKKKKSNEYFAQFSASKHDTANWRGKRTA